MSKITALIERWHELDASLATQFDAVQFESLNSLIQRYQQPRHTTNTVLAQKLEARITTFIERFESWRKLAHQRSQETGSGASGDEFEPSLIATLKHELGKHHEALEPENAFSLDEKLFEQEQMVRQQEDETLSNRQDGSGEQLELQSMKNFRQTMKYFNVDRLIERALQECPQNPGPHNPQMLAIKSLRTMQTLSPQYLRRFAGYIETMLWLEKNSSRLVDKK